MPKDVKWNRGPPPSLGWWPASFSKDNNIYRWWDGVAWSRAASGKTTAYSAAQSAKEHTSATEEIFWRERPDNWPERSKT